jgi:hypothetical protein
MVARGGGGRGAEENNYINKIIPKSVHCKSYFLMDSAAFYCSVDLFEKILLKRQCHEIFDFRIFS